MPIILDFDDAHAVRRKMKHGDWFCESFGDNTGFGLLRCEQKKDETGDGSWSVGKIQFGR